MDKKTSDIIQALVDYAYGLGVQIDDPICDGELHRVPLVGRDPSSKDGAYIIHLDDYPTIWIENHVTGETGTFTPKGYPPMTDNQRAEWRARIEKEKAKRKTEEEAKHQAAAEKARSIYNGIPMADVSGHPYAVTKGLDMPDRARRGPWDQREWPDTIIHPLYDEQGQIVSLQAINVDGKKDLLSGGKKKGSFFPIGKIRGVKFLVIGEGLATVQAVCHALGCPGVVAVDRGNLLPVAKTIRELAPDADIIFLADDDQKPDTDGNPGIQDAIKAAQAIGGRVALPNMCKKADFWDVWNELGKDAVLARIETADRQEGDWPDPEPLGVKVEPERYPIDMMPAVIHEAVLEVQDFAQAPMALVATCSLSAVSTVCQAYGDVKRSKTLQGPSSLYTLTIAESGERKTSVDGYFTRAIHEYEASEREASKDLLNKYHGELRAWTAKVNGLESAIRRLADKGQPSAQQEKDLLALMSAEPKAPRVPRLLYEDITPEALTKALGRGWPSGSVNSSEAGAVLGSHGMDQKRAMKTLSLKNKLWDAAPGAISSDRASVESIHVTGARFSIGLQVQEETLREFIRQSGKVARSIGFFGRFLLCWPVSTQGSRPFKNEPEQWPALTAFNQRLRNILEQRPNIDEDGKLEPPVFELSPQAFELWRQFYNAVEAELAQGGALEAIRDVGAKAADNAARLACLFHIFEGGQGQIDETAIASANAIIGWHLNEARRFFGELALPDELAEAAKLEQWLMSQGGQLVLKSHTMQAGPYALRSKKKLDAAIEILEQLGRARLETHDRKTYIALSPLVRKQKLEGAS